MGSKLYVAFLWHMHQPIYKELGTNSYHLPWVRLHGIKSYYDMGKIVEEVEGTKVTFNFTPSLLEQLLENIPRIVHPHGHLPARVLRVRETAAG